MLKPEDCFHGNEVVCIRKPMFTTKDGAAVGQVKLGDVYTVDDYFPKGTYSAAPELDSISLYEVVNGDTHGNYGWSTELFRPIEKKVRVFYDMLKAPLDPVLLDEEIDRDQEGIEEYLIQAL